MGCLATADKRCVCKTKRIKPTPLVAPKSPLSPLSFDCGSDTPVPPLKDAKRNLETAFDESQTSPPLKMSPMKFEEVEAYVDCVLQDGFFEPPTSDLCEGVVLVKPELEEMRKLPKGMAKHIFDLNLSSSKTVEVGVCVNTFTPYVLLTGDRVGGKAGEKIRLRMTPEELQGLQSDAIFSAIEKGFANPDETDPLVVGGLQIEWRSHDGTETHLVITREGLSFYLRYAKPTIQIWKKLRPVIDQAVATSVTSAPQVKELFQYLVNRVVEMGSLPFGYGAKRRHVPTPLISLTLTGITITYRIYPM
ncbi:DNA replication licensing factor Mcm5 [Frankliniella fusca]|uniref:DNA replication licensing factor Mcm5 n=1 Tax=Frankliniella fusca TaxID=407009 RepID=A0AAE1H2R1_9NEOP|nr:DNA replication licensing factor Mcm5 [Frankliniella fusca]